MANPTTSGDGEPTIDDVRNEFPGWLAWQGISGLLYARKRLSSPPIVLRAEDTTDLRDQMRGWTGRQPAS